MGYIESVDAETPTILSKKISWTNHIVNSPLLKGLSSMQIEIDMDPQELNPGDLITYESGITRGDVALVLEGSVGKKIIVTWGHPDKFYHLVDPNHLLKCNTQRAIICHNYSYDLPAKKDYPDIWKYISDPPYYLAQPRVPDDIIPSFVTVINDSTEFPQDPPISIEPIEHFEQPFVEITSSDALEFVGNRGVLAANYLLRGKDGIPIVISDFHQKQTPLGGILIELGILPNIRPEIDWVDQHYFDDAPFKEPEKFTDLKSVNDMIQAASQCDCGHAATILGHANLADLVFMSHRLPVASFSGPGARFGTEINPLNYLRPFIRRNDRQPHWLSFDLDYLLSICKRSGKNGKERFDPVTIQSALSWMKDGGMTSDQYDAVFLYTSPGYIGYNDVGLIKEAIEIGLSLFI